LRAFIDIAHNHAQTGKSAFGGLPKTSRGHDVAVSCAQHFYQRAFEAVFEANFRTSHPEPASLTSALVAARY